MISLGVKGADTLRRAEQARRGLREEEEEAGKGGGRTAGLVVLRCR